MLQAEIRYSLSIINRSQKRIAHQHELLTHISDPALLMVCEDIVAAMEAKLVALQSSHRSMLARVTV